MQKNHLISVETLLFIVCMMSFICWSSVIDAQAVEPETPVHFADPALKAAVQKALGKSDPTPTDMRSLSFLYASELGIVDLTGLEYATNLRSLGLYSNRICDLTPLAELVNLNQLGLWGNQVRNISALEGLRNLIYLDLGSNEINDISSLAELTNLTDLSLGGNQISDIAALAELVNLTDLDLSYNVITNISALAELTKLEDLDLGHNTIVDISPLSNLRKLQFLNLSSNPIQHISPLAGLTGLKTLYASKCQIVDISALAALTGLEQLSFWGNQVADIDAISGLKSLKVLSASHNQITDISAIAELSNLQEVDFWNNRIIDCSPLAGLSNLSYLNLDDNRIHNINSLWALTNLTYLCLAGNRISDISALSGLTNLELLYLEGNQISEVSSLSKLTNLRVLDLRWNPLNCAAYCIYIPMIKDNNPVVELRFDPKPATCICPPEIRNIYYVDCQADGVNNGSSWTDAFNHLQDALRTAGYGDEIWVAQGVYRPDEGIGFTPGDRYATFKLKNGVTVSGGYAGVTESDPNALDINRFRTILSGDLGGNDVGECGDPSMNENSLHVVTGSYTDSTAKLEGFTIIGGMANILPRYGAGIRIDDGSPIIQRCTFAHNYAVGCGGGLWCLGSGGSFEDPTSTILIDCIFTGNHAEYGGAIYAASWPPITLENCSIIGNSAGVAGGGVSGGAEDAEGGYLVGGGGYFRLAACIFADNHAERSGAIEIEETGTYPQYSDDIETSNLVIDTLTILANGPDAGLIQNAYVLLEGDLSLMYGRLNIISSLLEGVGRITLGKEAQLRFIGYWKNEPITILRTSVQGPGQIEVDVGQQLIIEGNAVVSLSSSPGELADPNLDGRIIVNGSLVVQGNATIESTNIDVKLFDINDPNVIQYNNIKLLEASTGFGGEFFVSENARIKNNNIVSEGDRYLDLDPRPDDANHPTIENNRITVIIKEGKLSSQGTLLELRAKDYDAGTPTNPIGSSGAYLVAATSPGFTEDPSDNWVLERLILEPNSKLNLTNRQGFEFQDFGEPYPETVYVKELVMGPNSVLNTALQTMYYRRLIDPNGVELVRDPHALHAPLANGARFADIPVLGFSLGIIAMNDQIEFDVRVRKRLTDPADNSKQPPAPIEPLYMGSIERIDVDTNPDVPAYAGGVMEMGTQAPDKQSASSVAAKGAFARAGDEDITVEFEYMFRAHPDPNTELIVYLSDHPEVSKGRLIQVATIRPPDPSRPGSVGSGQFAVFSGKFSRDDLNFNRGTYVELELRGRGACCWIDNWDPKIECGTPKCGDYNNDDWIDMRDYLMLLAEFGPVDPARPDRRCLDLISDGCVGVDDLLVWDSSLLNACPRGSASISAIFATASDSHQAQPSFTFASVNDAQSLPLVVFGKSGARAGFPTTVKSRLYSISLEGTCSSSEPNAGNGRLLTDDRGTIYQIHNARGIVRTDTNQIIIPNRWSMEHSASRSLVSIGSDPAYRDCHCGGVPLLDAAFKPGDPETIYVVPVQVEGLNSNICYLAAAKLKLGGNFDGGYTVEALYGLDPAGDASQKNDPNGTYCEDITRFGYEPDTQHLREIEVDATGRVYVLSSSFKQSPNTTTKDNYVLIYDEDQPDNRQVVSLNDLDLVGPTAMVVSRAGDRLYLTSTGAAEDADPNGLTTKVYCFSIKTRADGKLDLTLEGNVPVKGPEPAAATMYSELVEPDRFVCMITSMAEDPVTGTLYAVGFTAPRFTEAWEGDMVVGFFTEPILAEIPKGATEMIHARSISDSNLDHPLLLPLSMVWTAGNSASVAAGIRETQTAFATWLYGLNALAENWLEHDAASADTRLDHSACSQ
jgi:internalin A